ncbi:hypothetical protein AUP68_06373 [Ilyonectria robusta]
MSGVDAVINGIGMPNKMVAEEAWTYGRYLTVSHRHARVLSTRGRYPQWRQWQAHSTSRSRSTLSLSEDEDTRPSTSSVGTSCDPICIPSDVDSDTEDSGDDGQVHRDTKRIHLVLPGGKSPSDDAKWTPNMDAVRATIRFAIATGRLNNTEDQVRGLKSLEVGLRAKELEPIES